jgi:zinc transporter ZupT
MVEMFAESEAIAGELMGKNTSAAEMYGLMMWPSIFSLIGGILGVILAGISPVVLALTLAIAAGIILFISGEVWADGREEAGPNWSSVGLVVAVLLALFSSTVGKS